MSVVGLNRTSGGGISLDWSIKPWDNASFQALGWMPFRASLDDLLGHSNLFD